MIRIVQVRAEDNNPLGTRTYEVGINNHLALATFQHRRGDGLAVCLRKAADAVETAKAMEVVRMLEEVRK